MAKEPFSTQFNIWWALSAALIAGILIFGGIFLGMNWNKEDSQTEGAQSTPAPSTEAAAPDDGDSDACDVPDDDQDYPTKAPETDWQLYENVASVPTSEKYGPTKKDGAFWQCYAHSPKGALFASFGLSQAFTTGKVYDAAIDTPGAQDIFEENSEVQDTEGAAVEVAGFQIESYSDDEATIELLVNINGELGTVPMELAWDDTAGDWRWDAENTAPPERVEDADGFTSWSPRHG